MERKSKSSHHTFFLPKSRQKIQNHVLVQMLGKDQNAMEMENNVIEKIFLSNIVILKLKSPCLKQGSCREQGTRITVS